MAQYLTFQLYGPLQAYGTVAVGAIRPTATMPTRSAVIGLLAAALGIRRDEEARLAELHKAYGMAVLEQSPGKVLLDYHTIQAPGTRGKRQLFCRRDELLLTEPNTILSRREYLMDALFTVCLWQRSDSAPHTLQQLAQALITPHWTLWLGRKSCPPALPLAPQVGEHATPQAALAAYLVYEPVSATLRHSGPYRIHMDADGLLESDGLPDADSLPDLTDDLGDLADAEGGIEMHRDMPLHHRRRQFAKRPVRVLLVSRVADSAHHAEMPVDAEVSYVDK